MASIFITREAPPDGPLRRWAEDRGHALIERSLLRFTPLAFEAPPPSDWIFFYSPRAAEFFLGHASGVGTPTRVAAIGPGTAKKIREAGWPCHFTGRGSPEAVARQFVLLAGRKTVLFPRAEQSRRSVEKLLGAAIIPLDVVVYRNESAPPPDLPPTEAVILTSPLNAEAYFSVLPPSPNRHYLAIGPSTATALTKYGLTVDYPPQPTEAELVKLLMASGY